MHARHPKDTSNAKKEANTRLMIIMFNDALRAKCVSELDVSYKSNAGRLAKNERNTSTTEGPRKGNSNVSCELLKYSNVMTL